MRNRKVLQALVLVLSLASLSVRAEESEEKLSAAASAEASRRESEIQAELQTPAGATWAGVYEYGDGLGVNVEVSLAPHAGFVFRWEGCLGLYDQNFGTVQEVEGTLQLKFTYLNQPGVGFQGLAESMVPLQWGGRHYLIPADELVSFANAINDGSEPRDEVHGSFLLKLGDEARKVQGAPPLPASVRPYLLEKPIQARVIRVSAPAEAPKGEAMFRAATVTINVGSAEGVLEGMEFYVVRPTNLVASGRVVEVTGHTARVELSLWKDDKEPGIGWRLSTRPSWAKVDG